MSRTSVSPSNSVEPQRGQGVFGRSTVGSIGRSASSGRSISPQAVQNQTGIGVAKSRWREMHQSHSIFPTQSSIRRSMCSGTQRTSRAASRIAAGSTFTNHCRSERISIRGLAPPAGADPLLERDLPLQDARLRHRAEDRLAALGRGHPLVRPGERGHAAGGVERGAELEAVRLPPDDVLLVAEGADHHGARAEGRVDGLVADHRHGVAEERDRERPGERGVPLVRGVDGHGDAGRQELGAGRRDLEAVEVEEVQLRGPALGTRPRRTRSRSRSGCRS